MIRLIFKVFWRICIFYIGSLLVIMSLYPWNKIGVLGSPFVLTFSKVGIKAAAGIINFVVLTAALSSCNSGIFTTGRMLYNLSLQNSAPKIFKKLSKSAVPMNGIIFSTLVMLIGVLLNYFIPSKIFTYLASIATFGAIFTWVIILISQMRFRKGLTPNEVKKLKFPMIAYPYTNYISLAFLAFACIAMLFNPDTSIA